MERLEEVTHPKPLADFLYGVFNALPRAPSLGRRARTIAPKSIGREMFESYVGLHRLRARATACSGARASCCATSRSSTRRSTRPSPRREDRGAVGRRSASSARSSARRHEPARGVGEPAPPGAAPRGEAAPAAPAKKDAAWLTELLANPRVFARACAPSCTSSSARSREGLGGGRRARVRRPRRPVGRRALRGRARAVLRGVRRASRRAPRRASTT